MSVYDTYVLIQALPANIMGNKTISIDEICEGILIKMREEDPFFSFSLWIRSKMLEEYNKGKVNLDVFERLVPSHYHCQICKRPGHHYTKDCSHKIVEEEE